MKSLKGVLCTTMSCPKAITGWGKPIKNFFTVDCAYCGSFFTKDKEEARKLVQSAIKEQNDQKEEYSYSVNPVPCCLYIPAHNYYTKPIYTGKNFQIGSSYFFSGCEPKASYTNLSKFTFWNSNDWKLACWKDV